MAKINIRESLGKRDLSSDNKYDLRNTYDSLNLSESKKKQLAKALYENKPNRVIYSILNESIADTAEKYFCLTQYEPDSGENGLEGDSFYFIDLGKFASVEDAEAHWRDSISREDGVFVQEIAKADYDTWAAELELENEYNGAYDVSTGVFGESLNKRQLHENQFISQFSRYSKEYEKLDRLATFLTAMSPNKYYYYVEDVYFDFSQGWWWTTVIAKRNKNGKWDEGYQALSPRAQEAAILSRSDEELESLARQILASDFCPDKKSVSEDMSSETSYGHIDKTYWKHLSDESLLSWWDRASKGAGPEAKFDDEIFDELRARGLIDDSGFINGSIHENFERHDWENLIDEQGFVSINNIRDYIWAAYDGDLDDKHYCAKSIVDDHKDDSLGKVGVEIIDQYAYDHNLEFAWDEEESTDGQLSETYYINDDAKMARVSELYNELESEGWEVLRDEYTGSKYYVIFRKLVAGKGQWKAIRYSYRDEPEIIDISYNQATGRESLDSFQSFRRKLGKDLLPNAGFNESKSIKEDFDDYDDEDIDDIYDDGGVEEGNRFFADGKDYTWGERIAGPIHLDFDNWAVWSATESVNILDYATEKPDGGYDVDKDAFMKAYMEAPVAYFVVDEDTGFIDWGPCDTDIEAKDFLNSKQDDWENDD